MQSLGVRQARGTILGGGAIALKEPSAVLLVYHEVAADVLKIVARALGLEEGRCGIDELVKNELHALEGSRVVLRQVHHDLAREGLEVRAVRTAVCDVHLIVSLSGCVGGELFVRHVQEGPPMNSGQGHKGTR